MSADNATALRAALAVTCLPADWPAPANVRALTSLRGPHGHSQQGWARFNLGLRGGDDPAAVARNRADLQIGLDLPAAPLWLEQVHGCGVHDADADVVAVPRADAAVTRRPGRVLAILSADCLPVLFATRDGSCVAAAHAGWRGLAAGVLEATVAALAQPPAQVIAWIGPGIGAVHYEVDARVRDAFLAADAAADAAFVATRPGHWQCDLSMLARQRLQRAGVAAVHGGGFDTCADARFYSYRRDGAHSGRMASLIWMQG